MSEAKQGSQTVRNGTIMKQGLVYLIRSAIKIIVYYNGRFPNNFPTNTFKTNMCDSFIPVCFSYRNAPSLCQARIVVFAKGSFLHTSIVS